MSQRLSPIYLSTISFRPYLSSRFNASRVVLPPLIAKEMYLIFIPDYSSNFKFTGQLEDFTFLIEF